MANPGDLRITKPVGPGIVARPKRCPGDLSLNAADPPMEHCFRVRVESGSGRPEAGLTATKRAFRMTSTSRTSRKSFLALAIVTVALAVSACNTVKGVGRDIESVGEAGDRATR
jgi:predicted small secreted protein